MDALPNLLTPEARKVIASGVGPLFEAMILVTMRDNPDISTRAIAIDGLQQLLGPRCIEELFLPLRISQLPSVVDTQGAKNRILEMDPYLLIMRVANYRALRKCISEAFGGIEGLCRLRTAHIAEGGDGEDFNHLVIDRYHAMIADGNARADRNHPGYSDEARGISSTKKPWWRFW